MKKKDRPFDPDTMESHNPESIITMIRNLVIEEQVRALSWVDEPQRKELLHLIVEENLNNKNKDFISKVKQRYEILSNIQPVSFTKFEIEYYKSLLILTIHDVLYKEDFIDFLEWILWDLNLEVERVKFERENSKSEEQKYELTNEISSSGRYEIYLRALLSDQISRAHNEIHNEIMVQQNESIFIIPTKIESLFDILKDYFPIKDQSILLGILVHRGNAQEKLTFKGRANQLCNIFRQLFDNNFIPGYQKKDLERWLVNNFQSLYNGNFKDLNPITTERSISGDEYVCQSPLIEIKNDVILRASSNKKNKH